jgi:hypothetical protein
MTAHELPEQALVTASLTLDAFNRTWRGVLLALVIACVACTALWLRTTAPAVNDFDQPFYIGPAHDILSLGRYTDGYVYALPAPDGSRPAGKMLAPLYPTILSAIALLDPGVRASFACVVDILGKSAECPNNLLPIRLLHLAMIASVFGLIWWIARELSSRPLVPWIALTVGLFAASRLLYFGSFAMTESTTLFFFTGAVAAGVGWATRRALIWPAMAGLLLGLTTLTRPGYFYLFVAILAVGLAALLWRSKRSRVGPALVVFAATILLVMAPWALRNGLVVTTTTVDYRSHTLAQRLSYNSMSWGEYAGAYVCLLPGGGGLVDAVYVKDACNRFAWDNPDGFYLKGQRLVGESLAAAGGWQNHFRYLTTNYLLPNAFWHFLTTIPLALGGAWVAHYWGLVFGITAMRATYRALADRALPFLIVALPGWFMLLFHGAVSVNQDRYNLYLVVPYTLAGALAIEPLVRAPILAFLQQRWPAPSRG